MDVFGDFADSVSLSLISYFISAILLSSYTGINAIVDAITIFNFKSAVIAVAAFILFFYFSSVKK